MIPAGADLEAALEDALEEDSEMITVELSDAGQLDDFASVQHMITRPPCIMCADPAVLEQAIRLYQGRALYEGPLTEEQLQPLADKYGLIF